MTKFIPIFFLMIAVAGAYAVDPLYYLWKKPPWATGGTITTSGNYIIHTFTNNGTFTVAARGLAGQAVRMAVARDHPFLELLRLLDSQIPAAENGRQAAGWADQVS
jgi:hypothetical protein